MAVAAAVAVVTKALSSVTDMSTEDVKEAIDQSVLESAVDERGLEAIVDSDVLRTAINEEKLGAGIDNDDLRRLVENQLSEDRNE
ncbi:MAG TPA: hypothetical protein VFJ06_11590 [Halococcus sp.]|nr:hypothetical protein [Halococcus sp.]